MHHQKNKFQEMAMTLKIIVIRGNFNSVTFLRRSFKRFLR